MNLKMLLSTVIIISFIVFGLLYITTQSAGAYNNFGLRFIAYLDPDQIVSDYKDYSIDSHGVVYLSIDPSFGEIDFEVFFEGMSYLEGDDVEIVQIHLGRPGQNGPTILSLCNEKTGVGHCREGPGLSVEGTLTVNDLEGPLNDASISELIRLIESGESYVYVQSRDHPEGEIRGQIFY